jgi:hypothetical protein
MTARRPPTTRTGRLDLAALRESSMLDDLKDEELLPRLEDFVRAPLIDLWSVADGPVLIGRDQVGDVRALVLVGLDMDLRWALTEEIGMVRLGRRAPLPLPREGR